MKSVAKRDAIHHPLERHQFDADQLMGAHPPAFRIPNKKIVFAIACPPKSRFRGRLEYSRWKAMPLPTDADVAAVEMRVVGRPGFYDYAPEPDLADAVEWHVNFADPHLFGSYATGLFAQDEMQVAEHPALGALREALLHQGASAVTVDHGLPTPVLVMGVERRCSIATEPNAAEERPRGLYGNHFRDASAEAIMRATQWIDPPTITNLIAMAAPSYGRGPYRVHEIEHVLITAYTGFRAAVEESTRTRGTDGPVIIHTGFWGCGAFGGNRTMMAMLQVIAAGIAGIERMVFHTGVNGSTDLAAAQSMLEGLASGAPESIRERIERVASLGFEWGESNGT